MILPHRLVGLGYDSSPTSCGLLVKISNNSLSIKDECLIFTSTKICSKENKLTRKKTENKHKPLQNFSPCFVNDVCWCCTCITCEFGFTDFFVSREGGWEFHPYIRAALPTLCSLRSPTQTLGFSGVFMRVFRKT